MAANYWVKLRGTNGNSNFKGLFIYEQAISNILQTILTLKDPTSKVYLHTMFEHIMLLVASTESAEHLYNDVNQLKTPPSCDSE